MARVLTFLGGPYDGEMVTVSTVPKAHPTLEIAEPSYPPAFKNVPVSPRDVSSSWAPKVYTAQQDAAGRWWLVRQS